MAPTGPEYRTDWVWSPNSNMHVANNRKWFTKLQKIGSHITSLYCSDQRSDVHGIGDVEFDVKVNENLTRYKSRGKLVLKNVLYVPHSICNVIGGPIDKRYDIKRDDAGRKISRLYRKRTGDAAGIIDHVRLPRLRLVGMNAKETSLNAEGGYLINVWWPDEERAKWLVPKTTSLPDLTPLEKAWIKAHFKT
ncbi:hypothetical protein BST61_g7610 [Cercospora zeina]